MSEDEDEEEEEEESELELLPLRRDGWVCVSTALGFSTADRISKSMILDNIKKRKDKKYRGNILKRDLDCVLAPEG